MEEVNKNMDSKNQVIKDDEIDLIKVAKIIWDGRKIAVKIAFAITIFGVLYSLGLKNEFEANCKLLIESNDPSNNFSGITGIAGLAGINLNPTSNNSLTPELYPEITHSVPFLLQIVNEPIRFKNMDTVVNSYNYFKEISRPSVSE